MGLREIKKQQTRTAIADAAFGLFAERGFDRVTVAEVARAAGVAVNTVFNYFPAKEDLLFDRQADVEQRLAQVVHSAPPEQSAVGAVRADLMAALERGEPTLGLNPAAADFWRVVADSPALRARAREISENTEAALAAALADRWGLGDEDPLPRLLAGAINGTYRATVAEILQQILAGKDVETVRHSVSTAADQAFALLESSLADHERATRN